MLSSVKVFATHNVNINVACDSVVVTIVMYRIIKFELIVYNTNLAHKRNGVVPKDLYSCMLPKFLYYSLVTSDKAF